MSRTEANALLLAAAFLWGVGNVAQKTVLLHLEPFTTSGLRGLIGFAAILPLVAREMRRERVPILPVAATFLPPSIAFCAASTLLQYGYAGTSVTNASFLVNTAVLFTPFIAWTMLRERPGRTTLATAILSAAGVLLMTEGIGGFNWGDGLCLASALLFSVWVVLVARALRFRRLPFALAACQFAVTAAVGLALGAAGETVSAADLAAALPELLVLGVLSTGTAFTLQAIAQPWTPASDAVVVMSAESVFGALAAAAVLGERPTALSLSGAAAIVAAIVLVQQAPRLKAAARRAGLRDAGRGIRLVPAAATEIAAVVRAIETR